MCAQHRRASGTYGGDVARIAHDRGDLHQILDLHPGGAQLRLQIPPCQRALCLGVFGDVAIDGDADLPTEIESAGGTGHFDGLGVLAGRRRRIGRIDVTTLHGTSPRLCDRARYPECPSESYGTGEPLPRGFLNNPVSSQRDQRITAARSTHMDFGASMFFTDYSMTSMELAQALEARGFESVWAPEHSHIPTSRRTPFPGGGDLPKQYYDAMDPFVTLTAAAMATKSLKVGTGVCLLNQRDPIQTAKLVASIDQVSGGRFLFGIGVGWNAEEMEDHGTVFASRAKLVRERVEAMKAIWTKSKAEYHGEFVNFPEMMAWPKCVQQPHAPVIVGGAFPQAARRAVRYGDGWIPLAGRGDIFASMAKFRDMP